MKKVTKLFLSSMCALSLPLYSSDATQTENGDTQRVQVDRTERCNSCGKPRPTKDGSSDSVSTPSAERCGCHKPRPPRNAAENDRTERCNSCGKPRPTKDGSSDSVATPSAERCGCHKPRPPRDIQTQSAQRQKTNKCSSCQQAKRMREVSALESQTRTQELDLDPAIDMVQACCEYCEQPGSLGCQGENSSRCAVCQQGKIKQSIKDAAAAAVAASIVSDKILDEKDHR